MDLERAQLDFDAWVSEQRDGGVRLVIVDGLPGAGKSTLTRGFGSNGVDLDDYLPDDRTDGSSSWLDLVLAGGALPAVRKRLDQRKWVVVCGTQASPVLEEVVQCLGADAVRTVYVKRVTVHGDQVFWDDGDGLLEHAARSPPYFRSIYEYHGRAKPWETADLVIERIDNE